MRTRFLTSGILMALATAVGCGGATVDQLRARAAFDMKCPQDKLVISDIDSMTKGVTGCGTQATYIEACRQGTNQSIAKVDCTWVMNSDERKQ